MKITPLLLLPAVALTLLAAPVRANDAMPANLAPEMQELLAELLKTVAAAQAAAETAPDRAEPAMVAPEAKPAREGRPPLGSSGSLRTGGLKAGSLTAGSLAPTTALQSGASRLSPGAWRQLFAPAR